MKPLLLDQCRVLIFSIYLITIGFLFLFQPDKNLIAGNKSKIQKIAIRVIEGQATFKLSSTEVDKIKRHIQNHYQTSKIGKKLSLLAENQSDRLFEKMTRKEGYDSLKTLKVVDFVLDCQAILLLDNQEEPDLSVIQFHMKIDIFHKKGKTSFVDFREKFNNYFPTKVDSALVIFDNIIYEYIEPELNSVDLFMGIMAVIGWKVLDCTLFKPKTKDKLPDAPVLPEPSRFK